MVKYFCYLVALFLIWVLVGQLIESNLTIEKLIKVNGTIDTTIIVEKNRLKSKKKDYELRIFLVETNEYFRFLDIYRYDKFLEKIHHGDSTEIYVRPKWLVPLGMGYKNDIFQMTLNRQIIFDISQRENNANGIIFISLISILLFTLSGFYINRKKHKRIKE
ncbi:MAG: hypothetical protein IT265_13480 [Saprospiraceae bacterium]|nr:hypothetical protein [Saprospiraceae bacterium]